jgi:hypothetical protein
MAKSFPEICFIDCYRGHSGMSLTQVFEELVIGEKGNPQ